MRKSNNSIKLLAVLFIIVVAILVYSLCCIDRRKEADTEYGIDTKTEEEKSEPLQPAIIPTDSSIITPEIYEAAAAGLTDEGAKGLVKYNPSLSTILNPPIKTDAENCVTDDIADIGTETCRIFLEMKMSKNSNNYYYVAYDMGPSGDPQLVYFTKDGNTFFRLGKTPIGAVIPGDGFIYTKSISNRYFETYQKYAINEIHDPVTGTDISIKEVPQTHYYVGMSNVKANRDFKLRYDVYDYMENESVKVTKGETVDVLFMIQKEVSEVYLARSKDGVLGWVDYDEPDHDGVCDGNEKLSGICYHGD